MADETKAVVSTDDGDYVVSTEDLLFDLQNANMGTDRGRAMLDKSLKELGAGRSVVLDRNNRIIAGNKTVESAAGVGIKRVRIVETDGSELVAVRRRDLDLDTDPRARELAYADNRVGELDLNWNPEMLAADIEAGLDLSGYFYDDEVDKIVRQFVEEDEAKGQKADDGSVPAMALHPFEHYDYIMLVFRNPMDWAAAVEQFGIDRASYDIGKGRRKVGLCRVIDGAKALELCK